MTLSIFDAAREEPARIALMLEGRTWTYGDLAQEVRGALSWLRARGISPRPGDDAPRLALVGSLELGTLLLLYAALEWEVPVLFLHPRWTLYETARVLEEAPQALLTGAGWRDDSPAGAPEAAPEEASPPGCGAGGDLATTLAVLYTSGTTGRPKGVRLSRGAFLAAARASASNLGWRPDDRWLLNLTLARVGGLSVVLRCLLARSCVVVQSSRDCRELPVLLERDRVSLLELVPTQLHRLLERRPEWNPPPQIRAMLVGGAATDRRMLEQAADRGWPVLTTYGLTETCAQVVTQRPGTVNRGQLGVGWPLPGVEVRVVDGQVQVRGPQLLTGYFPSGAWPDPRLPDGWLPTGDLGTRDDEGCLHVLARRGDRIVTGGENVFPLEVEQALELCPGVAAACVFGVPHAEWGEQVVAVLVSAGEGPPDERLLRAHLQQRLARFKQPRQVAWLSRLEVNGMGKLDRRATAALARPLLHVI